MHLQQACDGRNALRAANEGPLILPILGPQGVLDTYGTPRLPLRVGRLPNRAGGAALPQLHLVCRAAFVGPSVCFYWGEPLDVVLTLAATSSPAQSIREKELNEARILAARARHGLGSGDATEEADPEQLAKKVWQPPVQRNLTAALVDMQLDQLYKDLGRSGRPGKLVMAQLRNQRGPGAMSWTRAQPGRINSSSAVIMLLVTVMVDPFRVSDYTAPSPVNAAPRTARPLCTPSAATASTYAATTRRTHSRSGPCRGR